MANTENEILINTEALNSINTYTMDLKEQLTSILDEISTSNNQFKSASNGKFINAFGERALQLEKDIKEQIENLNVISQFAEETLESSTELDEKIASNMID